MAKILRTKQEVNEAFRNLAKQSGHIEDNGQYTSAEMNEFLRTGKAPEKKPAPERNLTPEEAVEVLEAMSKAGITFAQAKAKILADQAAAAAEHKTMNDLIRARLGGSEEAKDDDR